MAMRRMNEMWGRIALALVLSVLLFHSCQGQDDTQTAGISTAAAADQAGTAPTTAPNGAAAESDSTEAPEMEATAPVEQSQSTLNTALSTAAAHTDIIIIKSEKDLLKIFERVTEEPETADHVVTAQAPEIEVMCVNKENVKDRESVRLELKFPSSCSNTLEIMSRLDDLCVKSPCTFEVFQEENSKDVIVSGNGVEGHIDAVADKLYSHRDQLGVANVEGKRGKPPVVLVTLILVGLALAAAGIGLYVWRNRRTNAKGMKLAEESVMADEENQGNTLVSVAPLNPPEPQEKPSQNGESPEAVKTQNPPAATNGHSATKTADTEL